MSRFRWTPEMDFRTMSYLHQGRPYAWIADKLGCGVTTVKKHARRLGIQPSDLVGTHVFPVNSLRRTWLRHCYRETVDNWIQRGWMPKPIISRHKGGRFRNFTRSQLEAFMENREAWVAWAPDDLVGDTWDDWREYARHARETVGWRWLRGPDAMEALGYNPGYASELIGIEGGIDLDYCVRYGGWWIRSDEVERFRTEVLPYRTTGFDPLEHRYGEPVQRKSSLYTQAQIAFYEAIGEGDFGEGVRRLADQLMQDQEAVA